MDMEELLRRINELAHKKKTDGLTKEELEEQAALRQAYLKNFREGFKDQLLSMKIVDENGRDITPVKLKKEKNRQLH